MTKTDDAPFAFAGLERVMQKSPAGLAVLAGGPSQRPGLLGSETALPPHRRQSQPSSQVLQEAGLVEITKSFEGSRPQTHCTLTRNGRRRFLDYLALLEQLVLGAAHTAGEDFSHARLRVLPG